MSSASADQDAPRGFRFRPIVCLGSGTTGTVWRCEDPELGEVAVKIAARHLGAAARERLRREYHVLDQVRSPNVVRVLRLDEEPELAVVMELVRGQPLDRALDGETQPAPAERVDRLRLARLVALLEGLLDGLGAIHAAGLVHRDVKPANALVTGSGAVKLVDLGMAETSEGVGGTLRYMAPELLAGQAADARSDLYSVGVMAYEALTGRVPHGEHDGAEAFARARARSEAEALSEVVKGVPEGLARAVERLLARDPAARPASARAAARELAEGLGETSGDAVAEVEEGTVLEPGLIGRDDELARLAAIESGESLLVVGPSGSGKTRLLEALGAARRDALVLRYRGRETRPLAGFVEPIEQLSQALAALDPLEGLALLPPAGRSLLELTPRAAALPGLDLLAERPVAAAERDMQLADTLGRLLRAVGATRPLVIAADDVDRASAVAVRLLADLAQPSSDLALVATASATDDELLSDLAEGGRLELGPLAPEEVSELVSAALQASPGRRLLEWLEELTGGLPGPLLDALRGAERLGVLARKAGVVELELGDVERRTLDAAATSSAVVATLEGDPRAVAEALAVLEAPATVAELTSVTGLSSARVASALQFLLAERLGAEEPGGVGLPRGIAAALREAIEPEPGRVLERRAAELREAEGDVESAVRHWLAAGEPERAVPGLPVAARELVRGGQLVLARQWCDAGLEALASLAERDPTNEVRLLLVRADAAAGLGDSVARDADLALCLERARELTADRELQRSLLDARWRAAYQSGETATLEGELEAWVETSEAAGDLEGAAFAHGLLLLRHVEAGDLGRAERHGRRALANLLEKRDHEGLARVVHKLGVVDAHRGRFEDALRRLRRARRMARGLGLVQLEALALSGAGAALEGLGRYQEMLACFSEASKLVQLTGERAREGALRLNQTMGLVLLGHYAEATLTLDRAEELLPHDNRLRVVSLRIGRALLALRLEDAATARRELEAVLETLTEQAHDAAYEAKAHCLLAEALIIADEPERARESLDAARRCGRDAGQSWAEGDVACLAARLALGDGDRAGATAHARAALNKATTAEDRSRARTVLALATADVDVAREAVYEAIGSGVVSAELDARAALVELLGAPGDAEGVAAERAAGAELVARIAARCGDHRDDFLATRAAKTLAR